MKDIVTLITGIIGHGVAILFLGWLAISIGSVPLYIIIGGSIVLMSADFVVSLRKREFRG